MKIYGLIRLFVCAAALLSPLVAAVENPAAPGEFAVVETEYDFGDMAFRPFDVPDELGVEAAVEVRASVHHPADLSGGPLPLLVFLHGAHPSCDADIDDIPDLGYQWPCTGGRQSIQNFAGYDYLAERLASHGFIVISISANGVNTYSNFTDDSGMLARAELIQLHLRLWAKFNKQGAAPFGQQFVGKVDLTNIGMMGHSRGGEGIVRHYLLNKQQGSPFGIRALFTVAPTDSARNDVSNVPLAVMLPYCDGDVEDLQGVHYYDDARYAVNGDLARKHMLVVHGANHNYFNSIWSTSSSTFRSFDDWLNYEVDDPHCGPLPGNERLSEIQQRSVARTYITAFFRAYVGDQSRFVPLLTGDLPAEYEPNSQAVLLSSHAPDNRRLRLDINRLQRNKNLRRNSLNGAVEAIGLNPYEMCGGDSGSAHCMDYDQFDDRQPHTMPSSNAKLVPSLNQLKIQWQDASASYVNYLPHGARDISTFSSLVLRAGINLDDSEKGMAQDFSVTLADASGATESLQVSEFSQALAYPPGDSSSIVPKLLLNTVRIPLAAYDRVNLHDIRSVAFDFDVTPSGALLMADIAFATSYTCDANDPDAIVGTDAGDVLLGTPGDDIIVGLAGDDVIIGLGGNDCIAAGEGKDIIIGDNGADRLLGGTGDDVIFGRGNNDMIIAGSGNDLVIGGPGDDYVQGDAGNDRLLGGAGNDVMTAGVGNDRMVGGTGDDQLDAGPGEDTIKAGAGFNRCSGAETETGCQRATTAQR